MDLKSAFAQVQSELEAKELVVAEREKALADKNIVLTAKEDKLAKAEKALKGKEEELEKRELAISNIEDMGTEKDKLLELRTEIKRQQTALDLRENDLVEIEKRHEEERLELAKQRRELQEDRDTYKEELKSQFIKQIEAAVK